MKNVLTATKWLGSQARPFLFSISIIVITGALLSILGVSIAVVSKNLIDAAAAQKGDKAVQAAIVFAAIIISQIMLDALNTVISTRTQESMSNNIRQRLFTRLSQTCWVDFSGYHSEDILTRMTSDVATVTNGIVNILPNIVSLGVRLTAAFITLMLYEPILAVLAFILGPVSVLFSRFYGRRLKHMHIKIQEAESAYRSFMHESIQNMLIVKAFCLEKKSSEQIGKLQNERLGWIYKRSKLSAVSNSALSLSYWTGYFLAFGWGALRLSAGAITFGTLTAFLQLAGQIQGPIVGLARSLPQIIASFASAGRLMEFGRLQVEKDTGAVLLSGSAGILLDNVSFSYEKDKPVLKNISFEIHPDDTAVLMGPSGEGKTTLVRMLLSLIEPVSGSIYFTDCQNDRFNVCAAARELISYVPQGNTLFSGTIADNLHYGCPTASIEELETALRMSCAWEFVKALPDGLNTKIGERGLGLSEGQAQRIAIARAFLRKTPILIFDEATSALDADTELKVLQSVSKLSPKRTSIIITHRTTALKICNRVLRLTDGCITEDCGKMLTMVDEAV